MISAAVRDSRSFLQQWILIDRWNLLKECAKAAAIAQGSQVRIVMKSIKLGDGGNKLKSGRRLDALQSFHGQRFMLLAQCGVHCQRAGDAPRPSRLISRRPGFVRRLVHHFRSGDDPAKRKWKLIHDTSAKQQPPALLLWSSLCYDPVNKQIMLFGGGGVDRPDGRPHTWALDVTTDRWRKLDLAVEPPARCNSRMIYDSKHQLIVLFGGDGQDRALADTWVFDVKTQQWAERKLPVSPYPRVSPTWKSPASCYWSAVTQLPIIEM